MDHATELEPARIEELLGAFRELQAQFEAVRERLRRADDNRGTVPRRIYDRVRSDYDRELDSIRARLSPMRDELDRVYDALEAQCSGARNAVQTVDEELAEAEFRHRIGEYEDRRYEELRRELDTRAADARSRLATFESALASIASLRSPEVAEAPHTADPEPVAPVETLGVPDADTVGLDDNDDAVSLDSDDLSAIVVDEPPSLRHEHKPASRATRVPAMDIPELVTATVEAHEAESDETAPPALGEKETVTEARETVVSQPEPRKSVIPAKETREARVADAHEPHVLTQTITRPSVSSASESRQTPGRVAPDETMAVPAAHGESFENLQQWAKDVGSDRRVRLSTPTTPPPAPTRKPTVNDEIDSALAPFEAETTRPAQVVAPTAGATAQGTLAFPSLVFVTGPNAGHAIALLPTTLTIGREHDNNVEIKDPEVARYHARILCERGEFVVEDLNSSTGTWVNGERKQRAVLSHGDVIRVGQTELALDFEWTTDSR